MEGYDMAWKQIVQPPKRTYHSDYDLEAEVTLNGRVYTRHDIEYSLNDCKECAKQEDDHHLLR